MNGSVESRFAALLAGAHSPTGEVLDAGAQMVVTDPGGTEAFRAPLARHYRRDLADPAVIWIRPILGGAPSPEPAGGYAFNLSLARRRSLSITGARLGPGDDVVLDLRNGQTARIGAAEGAELEELRRWDDFTLRTLTTEEDAALDALDGDSWYGRFG